MSKEFTAGVLRIAWDTEAEPTQISGHEGKVFKAKIIGCDTPGGLLLRDILNKALLNLVVRAPDDALSRIAGIESFATMRLHADMPIGLLLVSVNER